MVVWSLARRMEDHQHASEAAVMRTDNKNLQLVSYPALLIDWLDCKSTLNVASDIYYLNALVVQNGWMYI